MDDLTVLKKVRAAEPGPSAAETTAARNALLTAIEAACGASSGRRRARSAVRRTAGRRVWVPVVAAAATVAVGGGALLLAPGGSQPAASRPAVPRQTSPGAASHPVGPVAPVYQPATLTAAVVLDKAAAAAAREDSTTGRYFFTESEVVGSAFAWTGSAPAYRTGPSLRRMWFGNGVDGSLVMAVGPGQRAFNLGPSSNSGLTWAQLRALPTAPAPLLAIVARLAVDFNPKYPGSTAFSEFEIIGQLLFESPISPAVQAALYQVAAGLPGIKVTDTSDLVGRPAVEVYMEPGPEDPPGLGHALYFSQVTFQLLDEATINAVNVSCPVLASYAILATGYVNSDTQLPAGTPTQLEPAYYSNSAPGCPTLLVGTPPGMRGKLSKAALRRLAERRKRH
jgi:hypothetical protein